MNERTEALLTGKSEIEERDVATVMGFALKQVKSNLAEFTYQFKKAYNEEGMYHPTGDMDWIAGLRTGQMWLAYEWTKRIGDEAGAEALEAVGEIQTGNFLEWVEKKIEVDHHDMGLPYSPSCVAGFKLMGSEKGKGAAIKAADQLISRFHPVGEFIQTRGPMDQLENYRFITGCLLNLSPLYWASEGTGDEKHWEIAGKHLRTAAASVIRKGYPTWHTFPMDVEAGVSGYGATRQGYRDGSARAEGQAWDVYGMTLAYRHTGQKEYIEGFRHVTGYSLGHLPEDLVSYWNLELSDGSGKPRDSSSVPTVACGMLEMTKYPEGDGAAYYTRVAEKLMKSVVDSYTVKDQAESNGLVLHNTYFKRLSYSTCTPEGAGGRNIWGDYFYMEALVRLAGDWNPC